MERKTYLKASVASITVASGCGSDTQETSSDEFRVDSPAISSDGPRGRLPYRYTLQGQNESPPIVFENIPTGTESLAVVMREVTDAEELPLWILWNLPPGTDRIDAGVPRRPTVESLGGAVHGQNVRDEIGYAGPDVTREDAGPDDDNGRQSVQILGFAATNRLDLDPGADYLSVVRSMESYARVSRIATVAGSPTDSSAGSS